MIVRFIAQPYKQVGAIIEELLDAQPPPTRVIFVSAWAHRLTLLRLRDRVKALAAVGTDVRFVIGIDLAGTSQEALRELRSWGIDARIMKHRHAGHTFHPKLVVIQRHNAADILIGSSNITEGGFFSNYEGVAHVSYSLPAEDKAYADALKALDRFLSPSGPTVKPLTAELLSALISRGDIATEAAIRRSHRASSKAATAGTAAAPSPFGVEDIPSPPALSAAILKELIDEATTKKPPSVKTKGKKGTARKPASTAATPFGEVSPTAFYMTLPTLRSKPGVKKRIPGEPRIPLGARAIAPEFWGWKDKYSHSIRKNNREYYSWKPTWRVMRADQPSSVHVEPVRMYEYVNSADFRFYSPKLLALGADIGDIVRIKRVSDDEAEYECVLAKIGTLDHSDWLARCNRSAPGGRRFGYD